MANLKAMHSISEVMQTPINSYVLFNHVWGMFDFSCKGHIFPKGETHSNQNRVDVIERIIADHIHL